MKRFFLLLILAFPFAVFSQNQLTDELRYSRNAKAVFQGTRKMSMDDLFVRMRPYSKSFQLIESARNCKFYWNWTSTKILITNRIIWLVLK
jgi:hypothetical protein